MGQNKRVSEQNDLIRVSAQRPVFTLVWCRLVHGLCERISVGSSFAEENHRPVLLTHKCRDKWPLSVTISELLALTA